MFRNKFIIMILCLTVIFLCSCTQNYNTDKMSVNTLTTKEEPRNNTTTEITSTNGPTSVELSTVEIKTDPNDLYSIFIKERYEKIYKRQKQVAPEAFAEFDKYAKDVYYFIYDIDGNGVDDLIMGDWKRITIDVDDHNPPKEIMVSSIYTIENGQVVKKDSSWWNDDYLWESAVLSNGLIRQKIGIEEYPSIVYFDFRDGNLSFMYGLVYYPPSANETVGVYEYFSENNNIYFEEEITKEEFERLRDEANGDAEVVEINWKRIDEYGR